MKDVSKHYDLLIENGNDPFLDGKELAEYMDKYDGKQFIDLLNLDKSKNVLEIGCGTGRITKKIVNNFSYYTGIDISKKTVFVAKEHFKNYDNISFINGDFINYDFNNTYDVIFSTLTFMHFKDKKKVLVKAFNLLNCNGTFVLSIDKNNQNLIDTGYSKIKVFPDNPEKISRILTTVGFYNLSIKETELAFLISANK